jgi:gliding motility-associated-like protein
MAILQASATGGIGNYTFWWSNGQNGYKTIISPKINNTYTCYVSDGCSNIVIQKVNVLVYPVVWSKAIVNPPVCYGQNGFAYLTSGNGNSMKKTWNYPGKISKDTFYAPSGNSYKVFLIDSITKCFSDTTIYLPGFAAIKAQFTIQQPLNPPCYTPEEVPLTIYNATTGATKGTWYVNSKPLDTFVSGLNPIFNADFKQNKYDIKLAVENNIGCKDTAEIKICYKDTVILYIPTAFTPNNDGLNDVFHWTSFGCTQIGLIIYNRWGEIIHKSNDLDGFWDGKFNGYDFPEGAYVVYIEYRGLRFAKKTLTQSLILLRNINK